MTTLVGNDGSGTYFQTMNCSFATSGTITVTNLSSFGGSLSIGGAQSQCNLVFQGGSLPTGLTAGQSYTILSGSLNQGAGTFQLATTNGGTTLLTFSSTGTGTGNRVATTNSTGQSLYNPAGYTAVATGTATAAQVWIATAAAGNTVNVAAYTQAGNLVGYGTQQVLGTNPYGWVSVPLALQPTITLGQAYDLIVTGTAGYGITLFATQQSVSMDYISNSTMFPSQTYPSSYSYPSSLPSPTSAGQSLTEFGIYLTRTTGPSPILLGQAVY